MKKVLSIVLSLAMVLCLMPSMAFASTTNSVVRTYTVAADDDMPVVAIDLQVKDSTGITTADAQKIKISLTNATWAVESPSDSNLIGVNGSMTTGTVNTDAGLTANIINGTTNSAITMKATGVADEAATVSFNVPENLPKDAYIRLYLALTSGSSDGEVQVKIDGMDSAISSGTYTVATVSGSTTIADVTGTVKTYPRQIVTGATVEITETSVNSITGNQTLKLTLPSGYEWTGLDVGGDMLTDSGSWSGSTTSGSILSYALSNSDRSLEVQLSVAKVDSTRQTIVLTPKFNVTKDAKMGDVTLSIGTTKAAGNSVASASGLVIAVYGDETVTVSTLADASLPQVVAGYLQDSNDKNFVVQVTIKEGVQKSLSAGRYIDFALNNEVQIVTDQAIKYYVGTASKKYDDANDFAANTTTAALLSRTTDVSKDCSEFTLTVPSNTGDLTGWNTTKNNTITLYIPVTADASYTGDITLNVSGSKAGVDSTDLVVGKVIAPISVDTKVTSVVNGAQSQATADITITENIPGYLTSKNNVRLSMDDLGLTGGMSFNSGAVATVTAGDLSIKKINKSNTELDIPVDGESTAVSTITVTGLVINMARTLPEGEYKLRVGGTSLVENSIYNNDDFSEWTVKTPYVNITTAADTQTGTINAQFVIGESAYTNNGTSTTMDAAPYLDTNSRTMVPIRYIAEACGISEDDITWNQATQTATINGANTVVKITMGSNTIVTSTGNIIMDTFAVNNNGRIYVPARFIANALGANVAWDQATKTVTVSK